MFRFICKAYISFAVSLLLILYDILLISGIIHFYSSTHRIFTYLCFWPLLGVGLIFSLWVLLDIIKKKQLLWKIVLVIPYFTFLTFQIYINFNLQQFARYNFAFLIE